MYRFGFAHRFRFRRGILMGLLCFAMACTYRDPEIYSDIENVRAKPGTHLIAVAVKYLKWQWPSGVNAFPNGGVPRVLEQEARIYLGDVNRPGDLKRIVLTFNPKQYPNIAPWVLGWRGDTVYFQVSDPTSSGEDYQAAPTQYFKWNEAEGLQQIDAVPEGLTFQSNTGPKPAGRFLRYSKGHDTVDVLTELDADWRRNLFELDPATGHLTPTDTFS